MLVIRPFYILFLSLVCAPAAALASLCIHTEELDPLIQRFAEGSAQSGTVQVWEGDQCDRPVSPAANLTNPRVEVFFRPGEDPRKRNKLEKAQAAAAAQAFEVRGVGGGVELRLRDRNKLFVDPDAKTATFIYRIKVTRVEESTAIASAADLDATASSPCRSNIQLTSRMSRGPLGLTPAKYKVTSEPRAQELAQLGTLDLQGLLGPTRTATFTWAPNTGGQSQPLTILVDGPAGRQTASTLITNKCTAPLQPEPLALEPELGDKFEGTAFRVRLGFPIMGLSLAYENFSPDFMWSASFNYDYDYSRDDSSETSRPGAHLMTMSWRGGPMVGDIGMLADFTFGTVFRNGAAALVYSPRIIFAPRGLPVNFGAGMLGIWDGSKRPDAADAGAVVFIEWSAFLNSPAAVDSAVDP